MKNLTGSKEWNNLMFSKHQTPNTGIAGKIEELKNKKIMKIIKKYKSKENFKLVEVGCEMGNFLKDCPKEFPDAELFGIDISDKALKEAKTILPDTINLIEFDITKDKHSSLKEIDFLICSETLEHIKDVDLAIKNLSKMTNKETIIIITVPKEKLKGMIKTILVKLNLFNILFKGIESSFSEWHLHKFSKKEIIERLSKEFKVLGCNNFLFLHQIIILSNKEDQE